MVMYLGAWGSQFQRFLNQTSCVFSQMKDIKHIGWDFDWVPWVMPQGFGLGGAGGQKFNFLMMVIWHIKLKGMSSRHRFTENFYPRIKLVTLEWDQSIKYSKTSQHTMGPQKKSGFHGVSVC